MALSLIIVISVAITLFTTNIWAGGDSKLLISLAPLFSPTALVDFFLSILFCGGMLSLFYIIKYRVFHAGVERGLPYGIAIVAGANLSLYFSKGLPIYS